MRAKKGSIWIALALVLALGGPPGSAQETEPSPAGSADPAALIEQALEDYDQSDFGAALDHLGQLLERHPELCDGYYYRALVRLNLGLAAEARDDFERFVQLAPSDERVAETRAFLSYLAEASEE